MYWNIYISVVLKVSLTIWKTTLENVCSLWPKDPTLKTVQGWAHCPHFRICRALFVKFPHLLGSLLYVLQFNGGGIIIFQHYCKNWMKLSVKNNIYPRELFLKQVSPKAYQMLYLLQNHVIMLPTQLYEQMKQVFRTSK